MILFDDRDLRQLDVNIIRLIYSAACAQWIIGQPESLGLESFDSANLTRP